MTHSTTHTPGPWKFSGPVDSVGITIWRSDGAGKGYKRIARNVSPGDAALIAHAWAIPQLVEALVSSKVYYKSLTRNDVIANEPKSLLDKINAALAAVKEGKP